MIAPFSLTLTADWLIPGLLEAEKVNECIQAPKKVEISVQGISRLPQRLNAAVHEIFWICIYDVTVFNLRLASFDELTADLKNSKCIRLSRGRAVHVVFDFCGMTS